MSIAGHNMDVVSAVLTVLSNPAAFKDQIDTLQSTINENRRFVEAIAPAGELMNLLSAQRDRESRAAEDMAAARANAECVLAEATSQARALRSEAQSLLQMKQAEAAEIVRTAQAALLEADAQKGAVTEAKKAAASFKAETAKLQSAQKALADEMAAATAARLAAEAARADFAAKLEKLKAL